MINADVRRTLDVFRAKHRTSTFLYSLSSAFYGVPAIGLLYNYHACLTAVSGNVALINLMITQLLAQVPLSYLNDTYSLWKHYTFHEWNFWAYADVSAACMTFVTQLIITPQLCGTSDRLVLSFAALVVSLGFFVLARVASKSQKFTTSKTYLFFWVYAHTMWHLCLPMSCAYLVLTV